jgi:alpha-glucosidase
MDKYKDFTVDSDKNFKNLSDTIRQFQSNYNLKYVPILDAGVAYDEEGDNPYKRGLEKKVFITNFNDTKPFIGKSWPGPVVYLDWLKDESEQYWIEEMENLNYQLPYSGIWIDMNAAKNFCDGY